MYIIRGTYICADTYTYTYTYMSTNNIMTINTNKKTDTQVGE